MKEIWSGSNSSKSLQLIGARNLNNTKKFEWIKKKIPDKTDSFQTHIFLGFLGNQTDF